VSAAAAAAATWRGRRVLVMGFAAAAAAVAVAARGNSTGRGGPLRRSSTGQGAALAVRGWRSCIGSGVSRAALPGVVERERIGTPYSSARAVPTIKQHTHKQHKRTLSKV